MPKKTRTEFVHLHLHTEYSLLDGACRLDRLMDRASELGFQSLAITDHGVMFGVIDFYQAAHKAGIQPIIGCEVYVAPGSRREKRSRSGGKDVYHHLVLLAKDQTGYQNLIRLVTDAHLKGYYYKPRIDKEILAQHHEGLIVLSGCLASEIPVLIGQDRLREAKKSIDWFKQIFGAENFYLELQNHGIEAQDRVNRHLISWASDFGLKLVATNDVHYLRKEDSHAHDALICIGTQSQLAQAKRMSYVPEQFYLRSAQEMADLFRETPEAVRNTAEVAEKCHVEIQFGELRYPVFDPPEHFTREGYLRHLLAEGLRKRYGIHARVTGGRFEIEAVEDPTRLPGFTPSSAPVPKEEPRPTRSRPAGHSGNGAGCARTQIEPAVQGLMDRVEHELAVIKNMGFVSYFLIVADFVQYGRGKGIACVARGSAASSIVAYLLGISNIDPIRYGLLFERFLNPERVNPPDIDIDFADDRRNDVIEYTRRKYGRDSVAQIITFGTMGAKSVIRDVGRVMGLGYSACDRLAKMVPNELKMTLEKALAQSPDLKRAYQSEETTRELMDTAFVLEDLTRNASVHAAGVVIGSRPLSEILPLKQDENGAIVTQYAMGPVGALGLLKMDFLGLKTLSVIRNTCHLIQQNHGIEIDVDHLPLNDKKTYALLNRGNTVGVFQLESGGMRDLCKRFQLSSIEHITALVALYRPGPMDLIPDFIRRRKGEVDIAYEHPLLEPICKETYGIMIYQEQVMQAAQVLAGYSLGGADLLRRAMGKKNIEEMKKQRQIFVEGCARQNNIRAQKANQIFDLLEKFAGYGFNKSHAAAYAVVAYQTAYLKAHYPVEFLSALLTNDMGDTDKVAFLIEEARSLNVEVLAPDINESQAVFAPAQEGKVIRFGLAAIKGVGETAVRSILEGRDQGGRFKSLFDLCVRADSRAINRKVIEALVKSGSCDGLGLNRATVFSQIDHAVNRAASIAADRERGQGTLFGEFDEPSAPPVDRVAEREDWPLNERLRAEKELLGFYVTGHPLKPYAAVIQQCGLANSNEIAGIENRGQTRIAGLVTAVQEGISRKSEKPYAILTLEDQHGTFQLLCLNENFERYQQLKAQTARATVASPAGGNQPPFVGTALLVIGEVNNNEDRPKIFPQEMMFLEDVPARFTTQVHLRIPAGKTRREWLEKIRDLAQSHHGHCPLILCFTRDDGDPVFMQAHEKYSLRPSLDLQHQFDRVLGPGVFFAKVEIPEKPIRRDRSRRPA